MSNGFLSSSFAQGGYLICEKRRRNSIRNVTWLTMIGFFGINHHDFLQLKQSPSSKMITVMIGKPKSHLLILFKLLL